MSQRVRKGKILRIAVKELEKDYIAFEEKSIKEFFYVKEESVKKFLV